MKRLGFDLLLLAGVITFFSLYMMEREEVSERESLITSLYEEIADRDSVNNTHYRPQKTLSRKDRVVDRLAKEIAYETFYEESEYYKACEESAKIVLNRYFNQ